jgi:polyphosphate kinase
MMNNQENDNKDIVKRDSDKGLFSLLGNVLTSNSIPEVSIKEQKVSQTIKQSNYISRDLSWLKFNERVLDQARNNQLKFADRLKFLAITESNLDEFFTIRLGSLYNYLDYGKERIDYSGLREKKFKRKLLSTIKEFCHNQDVVFGKQILPHFQENRLGMVKINGLSKEELAKVIEYFDETIYPMLTPMLFDHTHTFPALIAKSLTFGVVTETNKSTLFPNDNENKKLSFVQIPTNIPRFFVIEREEETVFLPIEEIVRHEIKKLYRNVEINSVNLFRIIRNGDFALEESDDIEADFVKEIKTKIKGRRMGRVVFVEIEKNANDWMLDLLKTRWELEDENIFVDEFLIDYTCLWQIIKRPELQEETPTINPTLLPLGLNDDKGAVIFEQIKERDILLHHPYNNFEPVLQLLETAAEDPSVLSIKLTIYRLAKNSRVTSALLKAAENGKTVSVLFEIKARFDEENNIREAEKLQRAGCFVIYGISWYKTHTKLMLIVRNEGSRVVQYAHLASGNYNEDTAKIYTDIGLLTANPSYTKDIAEFFNVITGHSVPQYRNLITSPKDMRNQLLQFIKNEAIAAQNGKPSGICIKINSMEDQQIIDELYEASKAGVQIRLIVRGICCIKPHRKNLSENIRVRSIVGHYLEHARIFYFHNEGNPRIFGGSADVMVRSFDKRIESLFEFEDQSVKRQIIRLLDYNLKDNVNSYELMEDGNYKKVCISEENIEDFNIHKEFFNQPTENQLINNTLDFNIN